MSDKQKTPYIALEFEVAEDDEGRRRTESTSVRIVVLRRGPCNAANRNDWPIVAVETCEGKDALGAPIWRPSSLLSTEVAAAIVFKLEEEKRLAELRARTSDTRMGA